MSTTEPGWSVPRGWPEAVELERLANELFSAATGAIRSPAPPRGAGGAPIADVPSERSIGIPSVANDLVAGIPPAATTPGAIELPAEAELRELLAGISPRGVTDTRPFPPSNYYFLEFARIAPGGLQVPGAPWDQAAAATPAPVAPPYDVNLVRRDFPILQERINGRPLVWLDNAATTQKPQAVIDRLSHYYQHENSNVHRAAHELAARSTDAYEGARVKVQTFLNAPSPHEIVFVRGATEAINLVAQAWGRQHVGTEDEIVVSWLEHHANIVPWLQLAEETGARLKVIPVDDDGQIKLAEYARLLGPRTKLVSFAHVSNALGTITPARQMIDMAHAVGARVLLDGAQAVSHMRADVQALDPDWYVFSGHKVFAPTGIGVLYGRKALLDGMPPWQGGGNMIADVTFERVRFQDAPARFEAGTGSIADAVGLGAAIDYVRGLGLDRVAAYEHELLRYATKLLRDVPGLRLIGTALEKAGVLSFVIDGHEPEDIGSALNREGIAVRAGHHCAQPILRRFGVEKTVRASLALYNTCADVDALVTALTKTVESRGLQVAVPGRGDVEWS